MELYVGGRLFMKWRTTNAGVRTIALVTNSTKIHMLRAGSLLLLDILTLVPNVVTTNQLAQFIPFSIGALIVMGGCPFLIDTVSVLLILSLRYQAFLTTGSTMTIKSLR